MAVVLLPLFKLSFYDHPCADDFTYGYPPHAFWSSTGSIIETMKWVFYSVKATYLTWQGTFSSAFFMSLTPAVFSENIYWVTAFIMIGMIIFSTAFLIKVLLVDLLKTDKTSCGIIALITIFILIEQMHWPAQGIYWFNASVHYTFMHSCMLFLIGNYIKIMLSNTKKKLIGRLILTFVLALICSGSNYVTALIGILLCGLIFLIFFLFYKKKSLFLIIPLLTYMVGFYFNVSAIGNQVRQANFVKETPKTAILNSLISAVRNAQNWFTILMFILLIVLVPLIWNMVTTIKYKFPVPGIVTFFSFGIMAAMFTPSYYAMGIEGVARVLNIIKMMFQLLVILNEFYWIGWFCKQLERKEISFQIPHYYVFYGTFALLIVIVFFTTTNRERDFISYGAYASLITGQAEEYHMEYLERLELLESGEKNLVLPAFTQRPFMLWVDDITEEPSDWRNAAMANWYIKDTVVLETETQP